MSAQDIIAELPSLSQPELELVDSVGSIRCGGCSKKASRPSRDLKSARSRMSKSRFETPAASLVCSSLSLTPAAFLANSSCEEKKALDQAKFSRRRPRRRHRTPCQDPDTLAPDDRPTTAAESRRCGHREPEWSSDGCLSLALARSRRDGSSKFKAQSSKGRQGSRRLTLDPRLSTNFPPNCAFPQRRQKPQEQPGLWLLAIDHWLLARRPSHGSRSRKSGKPLINADRR